MILDEPRDLEKESERPDRVDRYAPAEVVDFGVEVKEVGPEEDTEPGEHQNEPPHGIFFSQEEARGGLIESLPERISREDQKQD